MRITIDTNELKLLENGNNLIIKNLKNGEELVMPNMKMPINDYEKETVIIFSYPILNLE